MSFTWQGLTRLLETSLRTTLDDADKEHVKRLGFTLRSYAPNSVIARHGDGEMWSYIVHSGWGCVSIDLPNGERQVLDFPVKGDIIGPIIEDSDPSASFVSLTEVRIFEAPGNVMISGLVQSPRLAAIFLGAAARQRGILAQHCTNVGRRTALLRVGHLLLEYGVRMESASIGSSRGYECPLTQGDLADALGLTPVHVNRMLKTLRDHQFVDFRHGYVNFIDKEGLENLTNFSEGYLMSEDRRLTEAMNRNGRQSGIEFNRGLQ